MSEFVHLRVQSSYSMLESTIKIEHIPSLTRNMKAVALTDRNNLFGALEFSTTLAKAGIQPIHGIILNIDFKNLTKNHEFEQGEIIAEILLLAKDKIGFQNLLKLASKLYLKEEVNLSNLYLTLEELKQYSEGIIALSAYMEGIVGKYLQKGLVERAEIAASSLRQIFGDRFYFEITRASVVNKALESPYLAIAEKLQIPLAATNPVMFGTPDMYGHHDTLLCIADGVVKEQESRRTVSKECYFKSEEEMKELFADLPSALSNTFYIAQRCSVMAEVSPPMLPSFTLEGKSEEALLYEDAHAGLLERVEEFNITQYEDYKKRLDYELSIITRMGFAGYFLIVADFIKWCKKNDIPVGPGRGSGAGSMVAWCLSITGLDPIKFGLLFERFLNPERVSMPDFDIDFCQERRGEVISYVKSKYGENRVAQIITFGKLQAKAVIKDVARVLGLRYGIADAISKLVPFNAVNPVTLEKAIEEVGELKHAFEGKGLYSMEIDEDDKELVKEVITAALKLEGLHRHASIHAAGIVISKDDLVKMVPLYREPSSEMIVIQYSMKYAELAGLVKFDFLGLKTLTVIDACIKLIEERKINISNIPLDDLTTYKLLSTGNATGIFQFESVGMKDSLRRLKPDSVKDLIALGALYRPGPMENIPIYIACKHGKQEPDYLHPMLEPILKETYGVIIYQEQVLEIAKVMAGYSLGEADLLRRAMGKKIKSEMEAQERLFIEGAKKNGISQEQASAIFKHVEKFAGYGFNKAHAAAYGIISYQTAYLKANYPIEFCTAALNLDIHDTDKINIFIQEARLLSIKVMPPNINSSRSIFTIKKLEDSTKVIEFGLSALKGIGNNAANVIVNEREKRGQFKSIFEFAQRVPSTIMNKKLLESLINSGAFDELYLNRNTLFKNIPSILEYASKFHEDKMTNQSSLFEIASVIRHPIFKEVAEYTLHEKSINEFKALGFFLSSHPLDNLIQLLQESGVIFSSNLLDAIPEGTSNIKIAGVIYSKSSRMSARGKFITLKLSDPTGIFEVTVFNDIVLRDYAHLLQEEVAVVINAEARKDEGGLRITVLTLEHIEDFFKSKLQKLEIVVEEGKKLEYITDFLYKRKGGKTNVTLQVKNNIGFSIIINLNEGFNIDEAGIGSIKQKNFYVEEVYNT